jgi:hypothetical protein
LHKSRDRQDILPRCYLKWVIFHEEIVLVCLSVRKVIFQENYPKWNRIFLRFFVRLPILLKEISSSMLCFSILNQNKAEEFSVKAQFLLYSVIDIRVAL